MASDEISLRNVMRFVGTNFQSWKFQLKTLFDYNDLTEIVEGRQTLPEPMERDAEARNIERAAWKKKDAKARFFIITACDEMQMEYLTVCETAHAMWVKLSTIHEQRSATNKVSMMQEFHGYVMVPGCSVAQHVARVQNLAYRLRDIGKIVDDDTIMAKISTTLPSTFHAFKSSWANVPEEAQTIANLLDRLLQEEKHLLSEEQTSQALAAVTVSSSENERKPGKGAGKRGKKGDQFRRTERKKVVECYKCHEKGHYAWECPSGKKDKPRGSGSSNKASATCAFAFSALFERKNIATDNTWFLDSCASLHSTFHREWLRDYQEDKSINIKVGNDGLCPVKGSGYVEVIKCVGNKYEKARIENVHYVPTLKKNLLSVGQLTAKGLKVVLSEKGKAELLHQGRNVAEGEKTTNNVYRVAFKTITNYEANLAEYETDMKRLHERLGHVNVKTIERMISCKLLLNVKSTNKKVFFVKPARKERVTGSNTRVLDKDVNPSQENSSTATWLDQSKLSQ